MSCCSATHIKRLNRTDGSIEYIDLATNLVLDPVADAAVIARLEGCPDREVISESVCIQVIGNTDPNLVERGKCLQTVEIAADGSTTVLATLLLQADGTDVTATHEAVACPIEDVIDVPVCDPGA